MEKITLNESNFTGVCKLGFFNFNSIESGREEISFSKRDIKLLLETGKLNKQLANLYEFTLSGIDFETAKEIVKRSPLYSELYYEV